VTVALRIFGKQTGIRCPKYRNIIRRVNVNHARAAPHINHRPRHNEPFPDKMIERDWLRAIASAKHVVPSWPDFEHRYSLLPSGLRAAARERPQSNPALRSPDHLTGFIETGLPTCITSRIGCSFRNSTRAIFALSANMQSNPTSRVIIPRQRTGQERILRWRGVLVFVYLRGMFGFLRAQQYAISVTGARGCG
jgi:hypothetical protein